MSSWLLNDSRDGGEGREAERMRAFSEREERRGACMAKKVESWWAALPPPPPVSTTVRILRNFALASAFVNRGGGPDRTSNGFVFGMSDVK